MEDSKLHSIELKKKEIETKFDETQKILEELKDKNDQLIKELEEQRYAFETSTKELSLINVNIEDHKAQIDRFLRDNPNSGIEDMDKKCRIVIGKFFDQIIGNDDDENFEVHKSKLGIRIQFGQIMISKKIDDDSLTFYRLKQESRIQFDKGESDFFFADEAGSIYLDEQNVKNALFPFQNIYLKNYEPILNVVEKKFTGKNDLNYSEDIIPEQTKLLKTNLNEEIIQKKQTLRDKIYEYFKLHKFGLLYTTIFIIFIGCYIQSIINYRRVEDYSNVQRSLFGNLDSENYQIIRIQGNEILTYINYTLFNYLQIGNLQNVSFFNFLNKNLNFIRISQKRYSSQTCNFKRFNFSRSNTFCYNPENLNTNNITNNFSTFTYHHDNNYFDKKIRAALGDYDDGGYNITINVANNKLYLQTMNNLSQSNWIDNLTKSILIDINFYNINYDAFIIMRLLFENMGDYFLIFFDTGLLDINIRNDFVEILSIILSVGLFFLNIYEIYSPVKDEEYPQFVIEDLTFKEKLIKTFTSIIPYIQRNFNRPNLFQIIFFFNLLFFFGILIYKNYFYNQLVPELNIDLTSYLDLYTYFVIYENITFLNCSCLLIFLFGVIQHLAYWIDDLKFIAESILIYTYRVFIFSICFGFVFILYANFIAYFIWGDFHVFYYKRYQFIFLKILTMFFKGSIDNSDYDSSMNRNNLIGNWEDDNYYLYLMKDSVNPYLSLPNHSFKFTFFFFSVLVYFITNIIIKVVLTSEFLLTYRGLCEELKFKIFKKTQNIKKQNSQI